MLLVVFCSTFFSYSMRLGVAVLVVLYCKAFYRKEVIQLQCREPV